MEEETNPSEEKKDAKTSYVREFRGWSKDLVMLTEPEFRPLIVIFIVACVFLVVLSSVGASASAEQALDRKFLAIAVGIIGVVATLGIVVLAFWNPFRWKRLEVERQRQQAHHDLLSPEERGIISMCVLAERGRLKDTNSRHISRPLKCKQGTLLKIFKRICGEAEE